jgi:1-acyl-sn-glycerol-3-phosphate acyltransferase
MWCFIFVKRPDVDYSYYLGPNWREELKARKKPISTLVMNHSSFLDIWLMLSSKWSPAFIAKSDNKTSIVGP